MIARLQVLKPLDCYHCHECGGLVEYPRADPPRGWGHTLCDSCDVLDERRAHAVLANPPPLDPDADVRTLTPRLIDDLLDAPTYSPDPHLSALLEDR